MYITIENDQINLRKNIEIKNIENLKIVFLISRISGRIFFLSFAISGDLFQQLRSQLG
jgi:hypothetical protein